MKWFILFVGIVVICLVAALVLGLISGGVGGRTSSLRHEPLPDTPLTEADLEGLQLDVTARGYRMSQVDGVLDRLRRELRENLQARIRGNSIHRWVFDQLTDILALKRTVSYRITTSPFFLESVDRIARNTEASS